MKPEEREVTERRLIEINRRLGFMSSPEARDEVVPELDAGEMDALFKERDLLLKDGRGRGLISRLMPLTSRSVFPQHRCCD